MVFCSRTSNVHTVIETLVSTQAELARDQVQINDLQGHLRTLAQGCPTDLAPLLVTFFEEVLKCGTQSSFAHLIQRGWVSTDYGLVKLGEGLLKTGADSIYVFLDEVLLEESNDITIRA